jgi:hypothetical protein
MQIILNFLMTILPVADPEGGAPPKKKISAFIHSPVKCNNSLSIFTRCIALLVYLITFEAVDD